MGLGYAGLVVGGGLAFTIEQRRDSEVVVAYEFKTGTEVWAHAYPAAFVEQMGGDGPRASPTLDGARLYSLGAEGELICLSAATGEVEWSRNILSETNSRNLEWGMSGAPLIVDEKVIVTASGLGGASAMAYDKSTGKPVWSSDLGQQAYASLVLAELAGRPQLLDFAAHALTESTPRPAPSCGPPNGPAATTASTARQPLLLGDDRVFISTGYGKGAAAFKIREVAGQSSAEQLWAQTTMKNKFNSSMLVDGHIYGFDEGILACIDAETGDRVWKGGRYGHGQLLYADGPPDRTRRERATRTAARNNRAVQRDLQLPGDRGQDLEQFRSRRWPAAGAQWAGDGDVRSPRGSSRPCPLSPVAASATTTSSLCSARVEWVRSTSL